MGQTNILQHKSWHVYNKKNIEKVRKDEEKARQEEKEKTERVMIAERESRIVLLRQRAEQRQTDGREIQATSEHSLSQTIESTEALKSQVQSSGGHINFWEELERDSAAANKFAKNPEAEAEKKAQDEKWERQITMYLDKGMKQGAPWYSTLKGSESQSRSLEDGIKKKITETKDEKTKHREDPLSIVQRSLGQGQKKESHKNSSGRKDKRGSSHKDQKSHIKSDEDKKDKLQRLREERLARERQERAKTLDVLKKGQNGDQGTDERDPSYRYHSQFNPKATQEAKIRWTDTASHKYRHQPY